MSIDRCGANTAASVGPKHSSIKVEIRLLAVLLVKDARETL